MDANYIAYQTLVANRDAADWAFWSMVGTWFAGVATFLAVLIALRRPVPRIRGSVRMIIVSPPPYNKPTFGIGISINNIGLTPVRINSLVWKFSREVRVQYRESKPGDSLPKKLEHGDSSAFFFENDEDGEWLSDLKKWSSKSGCKPHKLRIEVTLGTGDIFYLRPKKDVIDFLNKI